MNWRSLSIAVVVGICIGISTGIVENRPSQIGLPEHKKYGYPLAWRFTETDTPDRFGFYEFIMDCFFWSLIVLIVVLLIKRFAKG